MTGSKKSIISINGSIKNKPFPYLKTKSFLEIKKDGPLQVSKYIQSIKSSIKICYHNNSRSVNKKNSTTTTNNEISMPDNITNKKITNRKITNRKTIDKKTDNKYYGSKTNKIFPKKQSRATREKYYGKKNPDYKANPNVKKILLLGKNKLE